MTVAASKPIIQLLGVLPFVLVNCGPPHTDGMTDEELCAALTVDDCNGQQCIDVQCGGHCSLDEPHPIATSTTARIVEVGARCSGGENTEWNLAECDAECDSRIVLICSAKFNSGR